MLKSCNNGLITAVQLLSCQLRPATTLTNVVLAKYHPSTQMALQTPTPVALETLVLSYLFRIRNSLGTTQLPQSLVIHFTNTLLMDPTSSTCKAIKAIDAIAVVVQLQVTPVQQRQAVQLHVPLASATSTEHSIKQTNVVNARTCKVST